MATNTALPAWDARRWRMGERAWRLLWLVVVLPALVLVVAGAPARVAEVVYGCEVEDCPSQFMTPVQRQALDASGIGAERLVWYLEGLAGALVGIALLGSWAIIRRRPRRGVALLAAVALVYVAAAVTYNPAALARAYPEWYWLVAVFRIVVDLSFGALLLLFPDGRFVPRWSRWVLGAWVVWSVARRLPIATELSFAMVAEPVYLAMVIFGLATLIYRCRRTPNAAERQKIKWVLPAVVSQAVFLVVVTLLLDVLGVGGDGPRTLAGYLVLVGLYHGYVLLFTLVPFSLSQALLRHRLWDIDLILHRAFSWAALGAGSVLLFLFTGLVLDALLGLVLAHPNVTAIGVCAAVATGALFVPMSRAVQRFVDRSLFGIGVEFRVVDRLQLEADAMVARLSRHDLLRDYSDWQLIGSGGKSCVFRARHPARERPVAVKVLRAGDDVDGGSRRFQREAEIVGSLDHPNIVRLFGHHSHDGMRIMVMDYVSDRDLCQLLPAAGLPYEHALELLGDLCSALDYAHRAGIVHRDIKPSNILLRRVNDEPVRFRAVLTDFGIAKLPESTQITRSTLLGTVAYMSPEQIRNPSRVDHRSDLYSLGAVAYQMFTGSVPFRGPSPTAVLLAHLQQPPLDPRRLRTDLPDCTANAILRALAKRPADRWDSAAAFWEAVRGPERSAAAG